MTDTAAPALKDLLDPSALRGLSRAIKALYPAFDATQFLRLMLADLDSLSLLQRVRRISTSLRATLPTSFKRAVVILQKLAPQLGGGMISLALPDFVGQYGQDDFTTSMTALALFTRFGSSEFAIREFLRRDPPRTLAQMQAWATDDDEHLRRLASEGARPRLPWSFKLEAMIAQPQLSAPIIEALKCDPSLYVRKSVANHLNDIAKDHPDWVLARIESWSLQDPHTRWIARHALRTLIKRGDRRALALIGAGARALITLHDFTLRPARLKLGAPLQLSLRLQSTAAHDQRLVLDYAIHYVKKSGGSSAKVFKWKELTLAAGDSSALARQQRIQDFTTRVHHPGRHQVDILVNGEIFASDAFTLLR